MTFYAADGSWNVHVVDGLSPVNRQGTNGETNVTGTTGLVPVGLNHPSGAMCVTTSPGGRVNRQAPDGSLYINSINAEDGSQKVTFV